MLILLLWSMEESAVSGLSPRRSSEATQIGIEWELSLRLHLKAYELLNAHKEV